jgi:hypothetical protein
VVTLFLPQLPFGQSLYSLGKHELLGKAPAMGFASITLNEADLWGKQDIYEARKKRLTF